MRQHNKLVKRLHDLNPQWDKARLYKVKRFSCDNIYLIKFQHSRYQSFVSCRSSYSKLLSKFFQWQILQEVYCNFAKLVIVSWILSDYADAQIMALVFREYFLYWLCKIIRSVRGILWQSFGNHDLSQHLHLWEQLACLMDEIFSACMALVSSAKNMPDSILQRQEGTILFP